MSDLQILATLCIDVRNNVAYVRKRAKIKNRNNQVQHLT